MLEWNAFIKPIVYVLELVFGAVVAFGTADKLLFFDNSASRMRCAFGDNIGACASVVSIGTLCFIGGMYVLWKRLSSAFLSDMKYRHDTESIMCLLLSVGWFVVAVVVTAFNYFPSRLPDGFPIAQRRVTVTFAWLLWLFHLGSIAIAWFAPDEDDSLEAFESLHQEDFSENEAFDLELPGMASAQESSTESGTEADFWESDPVSQSTSQKPSTPVITDLERFLAQHESGPESYEGFIDHGSPVGYTGVVPGDNLNWDQFVPDKSIQDAASAWDDIIKADAEAETREPEIPLSLEASTAGGSAAESEDATGLDELQRRYTEKLRPVLRRRSAHFGERST